MYKIPTEEEIRKAVYKTFKKHGSFSSLNRLRKGVLKELKKIDENFTISLPRTRILTARAGFVKVRVKKKHEKKPMQKCPVCKGRMKEIKNLSLLGEEVVRGYTCMVCKYKSTLNESPLRYSFHLTK